jgi:hypothetical protein
MCRDKIKQHSTGTEYPEQGWKLAIIGTLDEEK